MKIECIKAIKSCHCQQFISRITANDQLGPLQTSVCEVDGFPKLD